MVLLWRLGMPHPLRNGQADSLGEKAGKLGRINHSNHRTHSSNTRSICSAVTTVLQPVIHRRSMAHLHCTAVANFTS